MVKVKKSGEFYLMLSQLLNENPQLNEEIEISIDLFKKNPKDSRLRNHPLHKRMKNKYAFSITDDIRIVYEKVGKNTVRLLAIGPHAIVY